MTAFAFRSDARAVLAGRDTELDDRALTELARTSPEHFAALYRRHVGRVHGFAYRRSGSTQVAEEVTSATFERALRAMPGFEWKGGGFEAWLFRIAARELAAWYRNEQRCERPRSQLGLRALALDETGGSDDVELPVAEVRAALATLRPRYQEVISLRYLAGLSADEASEALGCSKSVMAVTLHRAVTALRRAMR